MGWLLQGLGRRLTGKKVMRFWPDNGGWWEADVHNYNASTGQHRFAPCPTHCLPSVVNKFPAISTSFCSFDHDLAAKLTSLQSPLSRIQRSDIVLLAAFH